MSDIVEQLRDADGEYDHHVLRDRCLRAADEVERLRIARQPAPLRMGREAIEYLLVAVDKGWLWCGNCNGRRCMPCVFREMHDECIEDCPECCAPYGESHHGASLRSLLLPGWDKP